MNIECLELLKTWKTCFQAVNEADYLRDKKGRAFIKVAAALLEDNGFNCKIVNTHTTPACDSLLVEATEEDEDVIRDVLGNDRFGLHEWVRAYTTSRKYEGFMSLVIPIDNTQAHPSITNQLQAYVAAEKTYEEACQARDSFNNNVDYDEIKEADRELYDLISLTFEETGVRIDQFKRPWVTGNHYAILYRGPEADDSIDLLKDMGLIVTETTVHKPDADKIYLNIDISKRNL